MLRPARLLRALVVLPVLVATVAWGQSPAKETPPAAGPTMKAVRIHETGGSEQLRYEDAPVPSPAAGEILVAVHAAGVNPVDWKLREGMVRQLKAPMPFILGFDVSGTVTKLGEGVTEWKVGDEVCAYLPIVRGGGYAEAVSIPAKDAARKPASVDHVHAASVPLAALTAWQAMFDKANLQPGQTILIHGAAGGVGHFAVQLAKAKGATVIGTASGANVAWVKSLGADRVIDYKKEKFEEVVKDVDVVFDMIGGDTLERSVGVLKEGGYLVSIVAPPPSEKLNAKKAKGGVFLVQPNGKELALIMDLVAAGTVKPEVSATFPLAEAAKAQDKSKSGVERGKIVLTVK